MNHTIAITYTSPSGGISAPTATLTGDENYEALFVIAAGAVNQQADVQLKTATMQSLLLLWTAAAAPGATSTLTLKSNSSGSPQDTITLKTGVPIIYYAGGPYSNPFSAAITQLFSTDNTTNAVGGTLVVRALNNQ